MSTKRHQILGRELHTSIEELMAVLAKKDEKYKDFSVYSDQQFTRQMDLETTVGCAVLVHLGYEVIDDLPSRLERGVDRAIEYFFGDWWKGSDLDTRYHDKSRPDCELQAPAVFPHALLLGGLTGRWHDVTRICSWFDERVQRAFVECDDEYILMYLCMAFELRPQPLPDVDKMLAKVKGGRPKGPRLLCTLWEAAVAKDQKGFDKALKDSVQYFLKAEAEDAPNPVYWVAIHASTVWLVAERNGLEFPKLPEKLEAAVVRRQTTGLTKAPPGG